LAPRSSGQHRPRHGDDLLIEPADGAAAVQQDAASGLGLGVQEPGQSRNVPVARFIGHLDRNAYDLPAVFDDKVNLVAGLRAPEVQPAAGGQKSGGDAQVLIDQCLEEASKLAGVGPQACRILLHLPQGIEVIHCAVAPTAERLGSRNPSAGPDRPAVAALDYTLIRMAFVLGLVGARVF
jgi:LSD1 subclass zinc finger protein